MYNNDQLPSGETQYRMFVTARETQNYYKGEILPFININCRKDMTTGDIDGFQWDYKRKILRFIESKRSNEDQKNSQSTLLSWMQRNIMIRDKEYSFEIYKIKGDPPYDKSNIYSYTQNVWIWNATFDQLKRFLDMDISFDDLMNEKFDKKCQKAS